MKENKDKGAEETREVIPHQARTAMFCRTVLAETDTD